MGTMRKKRNTKATEVRYGRTKKRIATPTQRLFDQIIQLNDGEAIKAKYATKKQAESVRMSVYREKINFQTNSGLNDDFVIERKYDEENEEFALLFTRTARSLGVELIRKDGTTEEVDIYEGNRYKDTEEGEEILDMPWEELLPEIGKLIKEGWSDKEIENEVRRVSPKDANFLWLARIRGDNEEEEEEQTPIPESDIEISKSLEDLAMGNDVSDEEADEAYGDGI